MISLIEALGYRCLRYVSQPLDPFHVLVGPNASGKTTFLDVVSFLSTLVTPGEGLESALQRSPNFEDLVFGRLGGSFDLAVEARIPEEIQAAIARAHEFDTIRYEVRVGLSAEDGTIVLLNETAKLLVRGSAGMGLVQRSLFPEEIAPPETLLSGNIRKSGSRTIVNKVPGGNDNFYSEVHDDAGKGWAPAFRLGQRRSALGNMPADESRFPASTWLRTLLAEGVTQIALESPQMRRASPPGQGRSFKPDGSNIPWVVASLKTTNEDRFRDWVDHLRTALPDLEDVRTVERPDDRHRYVELWYRGGLRVPSWTASDGTLRLMALTLLAYVPDMHGVFLVEEPENGIHPRAVETMYQSLSNVYGAQILLATHSPVILSMVEPRQVLCFSKTQTGATDIVTGDRHPMLAEWRGETSLSTLYAAGVLG